LADSLTPEDKAALLRERRAISAIMRCLGESYPGGWRQLVRDSEVPPTTTNAYRNKPSEPTTPSAQNLLALLMAAGLLDATVPQKALRELKEALRGGREARAKAQELRRARHLGHRERGESIG
jgi:hypothetical protein